MFIRCFSSDPTRNNQMGGACGTYGENKSCIQDFGGEKLGKETFGSHLVVYFTKM
jgi:hypothetical protein